MNKDGVVVSMWVMDFDASTATKKVCMTSVASVLFEFVSVLRCLGIVVVRMIVINVMIGMFMLCRLSVVEMSFVAYSTEVVTASAYDARNALKGLFVFLFLMSVIVLSVMLLLFWFLCVLMFLLLCVFGIMFFVSANNFIKYNAFIKLFVVKFVVMIFGVIFNVFVMVMKFIVFLMCCVINVFVIFYFFVFSVVIGIVANVFSVSSVVSSASTTKYGNKCVDLCSICCMFVVNSNMGIVSGNKNLLIILYVGVFVGMIFAFASASVASVFISGASFVFVFYGCFFV